MPEHIDHPFFIVGASHSGIKAIKQALEIHPNLYSPNATRFYRWGEPFGTDTYKRNYLNHKVLKRNWLNDGFDASEIDHIFGRAETRQNVMNQYGKRFLRKQSAEGGRWFDATPQNIYGLLLIRAQFPDSKIVHIHRHPVEVVSALMQHSSLNLIGAVNHWLETMQIVQVFKQNRRHNLLELKVNDFEAEPKAAMRFLLTKLDEDIESYDFDKLEQFVKTYKEYLGQQASLGLSDEDKAYVEKTCKRFTTLYNYDGLESSDAAAESDVLRKETLSPPHLQPRRAGQVAFVPKLSSKKET